MSIALHNHVNIETMNINNNLFHCSGNGKKIFGLEECEDTACALDILNDDRRLPYIGGTTNIAMAMRVAKDEVIKKISYLGKWNILISKAIWYHIIIFIYCKTHIFTVAVI